MNAERIEIFGKSLILSERTAKRCLEWSQLAEEGESQGIFLYALLISHSLEVDILGLPWWKYFQKKRLLKLTSASNIIRKLSLREIVGVMKKVYVLEGFTELQLKEMMEGKESNTQKKK